MAGKYETILVFSVKDDEAKAQALVEKFTDLINENATDVAVAEGWGKRKLAYEINYETEGYYFVVTYVSEVDFPAELERIANITEGVLRYQTVKKNS